MIHYQYNSTNKKVYNKETYTKLKYGSLSSIHKAKKGNNNPIETMIKQTLCGSCWPIQLPFYELTVNQVTETINPDTLKLDKGPKRVKNICCPKTSYATSVKYQVKRTVL